MNIIKRVVANSCTFEFYDEIKGKYDPDRLEYNLLFTMEMVSIYVDKNFAPMEQLPKYILNEKIDYSQLIALDLHQTLAFKYLPTPEETPLLKYLDIRGNKIDNIPDYPNLISVNCSIKYEKDFIKMDNIRMVNKIYITKAYKASIYK